MASGHNKNCSELLHKLKNGQRELEKSLRRLENAEVTRKLQRTRRHLADKQIKSVRDLPTKRARLELLSPGTEAKGTGKHPRRFSSTPKKCDGPLVPPKVDSSLEEALLDHPPLHPLTSIQNSHTPLPSPKLSRVAVNTNRSLREFPLSQSFLQSSSQKKTQKNSSKRGLTVSFVDGTESKDIETPNSQKKLSQRGKSLVNSLNASRHGALDRTLSQYNRKFPRCYCGDDPKLGYDWIAGLIDASDTYLNERDDAYFEELREFRRVNSSECYPQSQGMLPDNVDDSVPSESTSLSTDTRQEQPTPNCTTCIKSYSLNDRLFPIPRHLTSDLVTDGGYGLLESSCPVCEDKHTDSKSPVRYIRVSVPKRTLQSSYQLRPHRRRSFDPNDSMGLSKHCLAGWESAKPSMIPPQPSVGLKAATGKKQVSSADLLNTSHTVEYNLRSRTIK